MNSPPSIYDCRVGHRLDLTLNRRWEIPKFVTFTFTYVCSGQSYQLYRLSFKPLRETEIIGEWLERFRYRRAFQDILRQCNETTRNFAGSKETLQHILRVKETLERLVAELN